MASSYEEYIKMADSASLFQPRCSILLIDSDDFTLRKNSATLRRSGFNDVEVHARFESAQGRIDEHYCDIIYLEIKSEDKHEKGFEFLSWLRARKFRGIIVVLTGEPTIPLLYRSAMLGANELLIKHPEMDLAKDTIRLLNKRQMNDYSVWQSDAFLCSGTFGCMGLSKGELEVLKTFADGFPRHAEIASRLGKNGTYIRKSFSRIYEKVENPAQLSHLITICSLFR